MKRAFILTTLVLLGFVFIPSNIKPQDGRGIPTISIQSTFTIVVGKEFKYQLKIPASLIQGVKYRFTKKIDGMVLDSLKGIVTWTPASKGAYSAEISAYSGQIKLSTEVLKINVVGFSYFAAVFCLFTAWAIQPLHIFTVDEITKKAGELSKERFKFLDFKEFDSGFLLSLSFFAEREHIIKIFLDQPLAEINLPLKIVWD